MAAKVALVTGSSGLVGSETAIYLANHGWTVHGVDNNMRADFFGPDGDTTPNLARVRESAPGFVHHDVDIRNRARIVELVGETRPALIVHAAAQPSHDLAASRPVDDFEVTAVGTLPLLRPSDGVRPRRVPDRSAPRGRRAARLSRVPREGRAGRAAVSRLRAQSQAGPRQLAFARRVPRSGRVRRQSASRCGLQPRR